MLQRASCLVLLLALFAGLVHAQDTAKTEKKPRTPQLAHIRLSGSLDEAPVAADPLFGTSGENFKSKLDRIRKAMGDQNIDGIFLHIDGLSIGYAKMEELRRAIAEYRASGKKVFAYLESGDAKDYLVASAADRVCMPAPGWLMLVGTRTEIMFYKGLFEKLGIRADFLQMGIFKFAAEPFIRDSMSKEARAQYNLVLGDFFTNSYIGSILRSRKGKKKLDSADAVRNLIDEGPFTARKALDLGLIDDMQYLDDFQESIRQSLGFKELMLVKNYGSEKKAQLDLSNPFELLKILSPPKSSLGTKKDRIALIYAVGPIVTGKGGSSLFGGNMVGSTTLVDAIREADKDPKVRAIVLRVDSPGGSALASDLIWNELKRCKKPVVASMSDVAASGGYYISMGAKKVWAQPGTLTGSIGVVGGKLALGGLYQKVGLTTDTITNGKNAGILNTTHPFSPSEKKAMEALMQEVYDQFLDKVLENRAAVGKKFTRKQLIDLAEGRIWTGSQALERGLIDALGGLDDAIADAKVMGGLAKDADVDYLILPKARSMLDTLMEGGPPFSSLSSRQLSVLANIPEIADHALMLDAMLQMRTEPVWVMLPHGIRMR
ncbi:MAG: signal peptide peptidase SppA [Planctomycetes bacterium]|nr:signal peptide peptidase SppA [Planctomycetota bacterium]